MKSSLSRIFINGIVTILPITLTIYALYWLGSSAESALGAIIKKIMPASELYWPGMGLLVGIALVFLLGMMMNLYLVRKLVGVGDSLLGAIPFIKTIYGGLQDMMSFFTKGSQSEKLSQVVFAEVAVGTKLLGLVTREEFSDYPQFGDTNGKVAVYFPFSYQIGGYTLIMPKKKLEPVDISVEDAMRFVVMAGMSGDNHKGSKNRID